jgi:hypothetical protein
VAADLELALQNHTAPLDHEALHDSAAAYPLLTFMARCLLVREDLDSAMKQHHSHSCCHAAYTGAQHCTAGLRVTWLCTLHQMAADVGTDKVEALSVRLQLPAMMEAAACNAPPHHSALRRTLGVQ